MKCANKAEFDLTCAGGLQTVPRPQRQRPILLACPVLPGIAALTMLLVSQPVRVVAGAFWNVRFCSMSLTSKILPDQLQH